MLGFDSPTYGGHTPLAVGPYTLGERPEDLDVVVTLDGIPVDLSGDVEVKVVWRVAGTFGAGTGAVVGDGLSGEASYVWAPDDLSVSGRLFGEVLYYLAGETQPRVGAVFTAEVYPAPTQDGAAPVRA